MFYLDPPYLPTVRSTRFRNNGYGREMTAKDHRELAGQVNQLKGMVVISGYESPLYNALFPAWRKVKKPTRTMNGDARTEVLWLSPRTVEALARDQVVQAPPDGDELPPLLAAIQAATGQGEAA